MAEDHALFEDRLKDFVSRARIECQPGVEVAFAYECPLYWGELASTTDPSQRHCHQCDRPVYLVASEDLLIERATRGDCVAIILADELPGPDDEIVSEPAMLMGKVAVLPRRPRRP